MARGAPSSSSCGAQAPGFGARLGPEQIVDAATRAWSRPGRSRSTISPGVEIGRGGAQQIGDVELEAGRGLLEQGEADLLGQVGLVELGPQRLHVEQALGGDEGGRGLAEGGALLLGQREGRDDAEPVDEAVGDLGGDDLVAAGGARAGSPRRAAPASPAGRRRAVRASSVGSSVQLRLLDRRLQRASWRSTAAPPARAGSGPDWPGRGAATPRSCPSPSTARLSRPLSSSNLDHADQLRQRPRAAALGDRQGQRLQPVVLQHERRDLVGHLGEQARCASSKLQPALDHLAVQRDLDVDLIVRAIDAGANCR